MKEHKIIHVKKLKINCESMRKSSIRYQTIHVTLARKSLSFPKNTWNLKISNTILSPQERKLIYMSTNKLDFVGFGITEDASLDILNASFSMKKLLIVAFKRVLD